MAEPPAPDRPPQRQRRPKVAASPPPNGAPQRQSGAKAAAPSQPGDPRPQRPRRPEVREGFVAVGVVLTSFGLRGDLKVEALTDFPARFDPGAMVWLAGVERRVERSRWRAKIVFVKLSGIDTPEQVAALRGELIEVPESERAVLAPDQYYQSDIIGLRVETLAGEPVGSVVEFQPSGGNDVLVVRGERGDVLIPMIEDVVKSVDIPAGRIVIDPIEGLLSEPAVPKPPRRVSPRVFRRQFRRGRQ